MARYSDAIFWIIANDDTEWMDEDREELLMSVTACLVQDLFNKTKEEIIRDLRAERLRQRKPVTIFTKIRTYG